MTQRRQIGDSVPPDPLAGDRSRMGERLDRVAQASTQLAQLRSRPRRRIEHSPIAMDQRPVNVSRSRDEVVRMSIAGYPVALAAGRQQPAAQLIDRVRREMIPACRALAAIDASLAFDPHALADRMVALHYVQIAQTVDPRQEGRAKRQN